MRYRNFFSTLIIVGLFVTAVLSNRIWAQRGGGPPLNKNPCAQGVCRVTCNTDRFERGAASCMLYDEDGNETRGVCCEVDCEAVDTAGESVLKYPVCAFQELPTLAVYFIDAVIITTALLSLFVFLLGGFYYITAGTNQSQAEKARSAMLWSSIAVVIAFSAYSFVKWLAPAFGVTIFG